MRKVLSLICCLSVALSLSPLTTRPQTDRGGGVRLSRANGQTQTVQLYKRSYALLVGNSVYSNWTHLPGVRQDMTEVADALKKHGFQIVSFNERREPVADRPALNLTRDEFRQQIELFTDEYGQDEDHRLLVYYAGHGYTALLPDGRKMGYLVMRDAPRMPPAEEALARPLSGRQLAELRRASITMDEIETFAKNLQARHALFVFDSCFAGTVLFRGEPSVPRHLTDEVVKPVRAFLTAGNEYQVVPDDSFFRRAFVRGIDGAADADYGDSPRDGYVLATELYLYVKQEVGKYTGNRQTPTFGKISNQDLARGDFVFTVNQPRAAVADSPPSRPAESRRAPVTESRPPRADSTQPSPAASIGLGLHLEVYCRNRYGPASSATFTEGNPYSWRCMVREAQRGTVFHELDLYHVCRQQYGDDFGPTLRDAREARSWECRETFAFDYSAGDSRGERRWVMKDASEWSEQVPDGTINCFKVTAAATYYGMTGAILRNCNGRYEVFVPARPRKGKSLLVRTDASHPWSQLATIK